MELWCKCFPLRPTKFFFYKLKREWGENVEVWVKLLFHHSSNLVSTTRSTIIYKFSPNNLVNLNKLLFSSSHFFSQPNKEKYKFFLSFQPNTHDGKHKSFLSSHFSFLLTFIHPNTLSKREGEKISLHCLNAWKIKLKSSFFVPILHLNYWKNIFKKFRN